MKREYPMTREIKFALHAIGGNFHDAIDLEHLIDRKVNLCEPGTIVKRDYHR
jgi:hypothetical protein